MRCRGANVFFSTCDARTAASSSSSSAKSGTCLSSWESQDMGHLATANCYKRLLQDVVGEFHHANGCLGHLLESRAFALRQSSGTSCDSTAHSANCVLPRCVASACMIRPCGSAPTKSIKAFRSRHTESVQNFRANGRASRE